MTNQEARRMLAGLEAAYRDLDSSMLTDDDTIQLVSKRIEAIGVAISALEKQIPKKPYMNVIHYPYTSDLTTVQCPNCKRRLRTRRTQAKGDKFCPDCGQAIDRKEGE